MTSGARQPGKFVPWSSQAEREYVKQLLFSEDHEDIQLGCDFVRLWAFRGRIPTAIEATGNLVKLKLRLEAILGPLGELDMNKEDVVAEDYHELQLAATMAIVRFVNEMVDPGQKSSYAQPITRLAEQIGLPRTLVDLRHSGTHDELPSLGLLHLAVDQSIDWLRTKYWEPASNWKAVLVDKCADVLERLKQELDEFERKEQPDMAADVLKQKRIRIASKSLNGIEHLEVSRQVQEVFLEVLLRSALVTDASFVDLIFETLLSWCPERFKLSVNNMTSMPLTDLRTRYPWIAEGKPDTIISAPSVDEMLDETELLLKRLEEKKRRKVESGWYRLDQWTPCDLGSPFNFADFIPSESKP